MLSIQYAFEISRSVIFEVRYHRTDNNPAKYFATAACQFNRPKTDYNRCGQAQEDLLRPGSPARTFYDKWDKKHLLDLTQTEYTTLLGDLKHLEYYYNFIMNVSDNSFSFKELKALSKLIIKKGN